MAHSRRTFLTGLISFAVAAPAIVKAVNLMPVKAILDFEELPFQYQFLYNEIALGYAITREAIDRNLYGKAFGDNAKITETNEINWASLLRGTEIQTPLDPTH